MTAERAIILVKKVTYFGEFGYLNSSCIRKDIILMFSISSRDKFTLFVAKLSDRCFYLLKATGAHPVLRKYAR